MADGLATSGIQDLGTDALTTSSQGLSAPIRGFRFTANFQNLGTTSFKSVEGFSTEVESTDYREGGFGYLTKRKLPGLVNYTEITLQKGLYNNPALYNFFNDYLEGNNFTPVNAVITVYNNAGTPTASWTVINAWPSKYESTGLTADSSDIIVETLVLVHEGIKRDATPQAG